MSARRRRDATWLLTSGLGQAGLAFAANLALVRLLSPEDFGRFALALAAVTLVTSLVSLRTSALAVRARSLGPRRRRLYLDAALFETALALGLAGTWLHLSGGFDLWMLLLLAGCGPAAASPGAVLAQAPVDRGEQEHMAECDDGDVGRDGGGEDQLDEHSGTPTT